MPGILSAERSPGMIPPAVNVGESVRFQAAWPNLCLNAPRCNVRCCLGSWCLFLFARGKPMRTAIPPTTHPHMHTGLVRGALSQLCDWKLETYSATCLRLAKALESTHSCDQLH